MELGCPRGVLNGHGRLATEIECVALLPCCKNTGMRISTISAPTGYQSLKVEIAVVLEALVAEHADALPFLQADLEVIRRVNGDRRLRIGEAENRRDAVTGTCKASLGVGCSFSRFEISVHRVRHEDAMRTHTHT